MAQPPEHDWTPKPRPGSPEAYDEINKPKQGERYGEADAYKKGNGGPPESEQGYYQALTLRALKDLEQGGLSAKLDRLETAILQAGKAEIALLYEATISHGQQVEEIAKTLVGDEVKPQAVQLHAIATKLIALGKPKPTEAQGLEAKIDQLTNAFRKEFGALSAQVEALKAEIAAGGSDEAQAAKLHALAERLNAMGVPIEPTIPENL